MKSNRWVITGTDTNIGKTVFAAGLVHLLGANYWKPIQSGLDSEKDSDQVKRLANLSSDRIIPERYVLKTPVSPHDAARIDGVQIKPNELIVPVSDKPLVIEGAGGLLVPLTDEVVFADVFSTWQLPTILCARCELGTINHSLLSLEAMRHRGIPVAGMVLIGHLQDETKRIIEKMGRVTILACLPILNPLTPEHLQRYFDEHFSQRLFTR